MIRAILYNPATDEISIGGEEQLENWNKEPQSFIWVDFAGHPKEHSRQIMQATFGLHLHAIQDAQLARHPPKIESFNEYTFVVLKGLSAGAETIEFSTHQLALFVGERFFVTHHDAPSLSTDQLFASIEDDRQLFSLGPGSVALRLCRMLINRYLKILLDIEPRLDELEDEVVQQPRDAILAELLSYKTDLKKFKRIFQYHEFVFMQLRSKHFPGFTKEQTHDINDVYEQQERAKSLTELYYELASDLADGYISVSSHHLNQIMKILTIVMSIFVPLSFLAGIYGMNFEHMPELHSRSGYFILLGVMTSIAAVLLIFFRKQRWL
jgi:magnesium transporter